MLRIALLAAFCAVCLINLSPANAQTLLDVGAANTVRAELEGRRAKSSANAKNQAERAPDDEEADQQEGDQEGADSAEEAEAESVPVNAVQFDKWNDEHSIPRYEDPSISWLKLAPVFLLLLIWILIGDWINRAGNRYELGYEVWSVVAVVPFLVGLVLLLVLPYMASMPILVLCCFGPMAAFAVKHNQSVETHEMVFTPDWFRFTMAEMLSKLGVKVQTEKKAGYMAGPSVDLIAAGGDERANQANLLVARQSPGYVLVKELVAEMADRGSARVVLDYTQQNVAVRHLIDGVWHSGMAKERDAGDVMLAVMKQLANLDAKDRRSKQEGGFAAEFQGTRYKCPLQSQGTKTGERVVLSLTGGAQKKFVHYADLGMRPKVSEEWAEVMSASTGLIIFSSMPEDGLTTLMDVSLLETDRLMRDFVSIEEQNAPNMEMENIEQVFYNASESESPATLMPKLIRKYPDVYVVRDFVDSESAKVLMQQATEGKLVITSQPARDSAEALAGVAQRAPAKAVAETAIGVIGAKLIRLLCEDCRVAFEPSPDLLKKLGIPAGKVEVLYREPKAEEIDKPCKACGGIGFRGRTGLYELLMPDDTVREVLMKKPKPEHVRKAARSAGMRTFQEEGILLIARGATSLSELQRVLKA